VGNSQGVEYAERKDGHELSHILFCAVQSYIKPGYCVTECIFFFSIAQDFENISTALIFLP
jgi:hypothetical protein